MAEKCASRSLLQKTMAAATTQYSRTVSISSTCTRMFQLADEHARRDIEAVCESVNTTVVILLLNTFQKITGP